MAVSARRPAADVVLMHTRGRPEEWGTQPHLASDALLFMVRGGLEASLAMAAKAGIARESIVLDPGYGFGKRLGRELCAAGAASGSAGVGPAAAGRSEPQIFFGTDAGAAPWRPRRSRRCAGNRQPGRDDGGDSARSFDCARSCGAAGGGSGSDRGCDCGCRLIQPAFPRAFCGSRLKTTSKGEASLHHGREHSPYRSHATSPDPCAAIGRALEPVRRSRHR